MIKLVTASALILTAGTAVSANDHKIDADVFEKAFLMTAKSLEGQWAGAIEGKNLRTGETFSIEQKLNAYAGKNPKLFVEEWGWGFDKPQPSWTHNVMTMDKKNQRLLISFQGFSKAIVHDYKITGLDENDTADNWEYTREQTGLVGGKMLTQRETLSLKDGTYTITSYNKLADSDDDFKKSYTLTVTKQ